MSGNYLVPDLAGKSSSAQLLEAMKEFGAWKNLSQLFQDYYSAVTSHSTHGGDRELVEQRAAKGLCRGKKHTQ